MYNDKFNENITPLQVKCLKQTYHLTSGVRALRDKYNYQTRLGSGSPIGTERIHQGYIEIKVKQPDVWQKKHIYLYEQKYGKIPKGKCLIFKDGNKTNCVLDNLMLFDRNDLYTLNINHLEINKGERLLETSVLIAHVIQKRNKIKRDMKGKQIL